MKPLIGVTTSEVREAKDVSQTEEGEPPRHEMALGLTYMRTLQLAGAIPVVIPPLGPDSVDALLDQVKGLCLSGGPDLDPGLYEQDPVAELGPIWPELDEVELAVARAADRRDMPVLAICRGMQALNVARGGTLIQHISDDTDVTHRQSERASTQTHEVSIDPGSRLAEILGQETVRVNSFHHQAIDRLGDGLRAVAWAPDGVVEAVEAVDRSEFLIGVQWHAECLSDDPAQLALFEAFTDAASNRVRQAV